MPLKVARAPHETVFVRVWVKVDIDIASFVVQLDKVPGILTHASCQGTLDEEGPNPYAPYVEVTWDSLDALAKLRKIASVDVQGENWGYAHPLIRGQHE